MEEKDFEDTITIYDAVRNIYYKTQVPHVEPVEEVNVTNDDLMDYMLDLDMRLIELEFLGGSYDL